MRCRNQLTAKIYTQLTRWILGASRIISCFPQTKPESRALSENESDEEKRVENGSESDEAANGLELKEEKNVAPELLKKQSPVDLNKLKVQTILSNKKWDLALKGLRKHNLAKVEKTEEGLVVELV